MAKRIPLATFGLVTTMVLLWTTVVAGPASGNGRTAWVSRYNGPGNGNDGASFVATSPDGARIYVTGTSMGTTHNDYATVAYDTATGDRLWVRRYNGPGNGPDEVGSLGLSPDGARVYVTGASFGINTDLDYGTVAYDAATGDTLWVRRQNGQANELDGAFPWG